MAGTSDTYISQTKQLPLNLQYWNTYVQQTAAVIETFQSTMQTMQEQIDSQNLTIESLIIKSRVLENQHIKDLDPYIVLSTNVNIENIKNNNNNNTSTYVYTTNSVELYTTNSSSYNSSNNSSTYKKEIHVFTNQNVIYVFSNKSIEGLYFNDKKVEAMGKNKVAFTSFDGSDLGIIKYLKTVNAPVTAGLKLYFYHEPTLTKVKSMSLVTTLCITISKYQYVAKKILTASKTVTTAIQNAIDNGINNGANNLNAINTNLATIKDSSTRATKTTIKTPSSITGVSTASNVQSSENSVTTSGKTTQITRSSGTAANTQNKKLR